MPKAPIEYAHEIRQCTFSPRVREAASFFERRGDGVKVGQTQVKGVAAHMKQAKAWTSVEVTERLAAQPPPPPCVSRVPLTEKRRVDGVGDASRRWREDK